MAKKKNSMKLKKATDKKLETQASDSSAARMNKLSTILSSLSTEEPDALSPEEFGEPVNDPLLESAASKQTFKMKKPRV
jgi:hypothetical protein